MLLSYNVITSADASYSNVEAPAGMDFNVLVLLVYVQFEFGFDYW